MGTPATFNYQLWIARFPEFRCSVDTKAGQALFDEAGLYWNNTACTPVNNPASQQQIMNLLTAHLAQIYFGSNGEKASPLVGRVNTASEGSVSVGSENNYPPGSVQWYQQTKYGSSFWAATQAYRTMHYRPKAGRYFGPFYPSGPVGPR